MTKTVLAFYKFVNLQNPQEEKDKLTSFLKEHSTVGTIILGNEGINGMCSLDKDKTEKVKSFLCENFKLTGPEFKENVVGSNVFYYFFDSLSAKRTGADDKFIGHDP